MTAAIDTNVLIALWNPYDALNSQARKVLDSLNGQVRFIISGAVYAELLGFQGRTERMVEDFLSADWNRDRMGY